MTAELKKEFDLLTLEIYTAKNLFMHDTLNKELWDWIEQKIDEACKFSLDVYTGRVNGSDTHQKEEQHVKFNANKESIKYVIDLFCDEIRKTNNRGTHNEVIAGIIGQANRMFPSPKESV